MHPGAAVLDPPVSSLVEPVPVLEASEVDIEAVDVPLVCAPSHSHASKPVPAALQVCVPVLPFVQAHPIASPGEHETEPVSELPLESPPSDITSSAGHPVTTRIEIAPHQAKPECIIRAGFAARGRTRHPAAVAGSPTVLVVVDADVRRRGRRQRWLR
jgi:hypothetical protein